MLQFERADPVRSERPAPLRWTAPHKAAVLVPITGAGWVLCAALYERAGPQIFAVGALPALAAGLLLGPRWGLLLAALSFPVQVVIGSPRAVAWQTTLAATFLAGTLNVLLALLAGWCSTRRAADGRRLSALYDQVLHDGLTGLPNRRYVAEAWTKEVHRAARRNTAIGVMLLDLDYFKQVNDRYGHRTGDYLLRKVAVVLRTSVRASDIVGRWGGEEFVVLLPEASAATTQARAEVLRGAIRQLDITVSIGIALFPRDGTTLDDVLAHADAALYAAKAQGRDRSVVYGAAGPVRAA